MAILKFICAILCFTGMNIYMFGQVQSEDEFAGLTLPPIEVLFEKLKECPQYRYYDSKIETEEEVLKRDKLSWLSFFSIVGTYQYGMVGLNSYTNVGENFPLIYQVSGTQQIWYNIGGIINIPLNRVFERRRNIRIQKTKINTSTFERDMWYEDQKIKVITSYVDAQRVMNQLTVFEEAYEYARAQFKLVENDFIVGKITAGELSVSKTLHMQANTNLENARADLKIAILKLETLTNTKIFKK